MTVANFLKYVDGGFYNGGVFHRTVRSEISRTKRTRSRSSRGASIPSNAATGSRRLRWSEPRTPACGTSKERSRWRATGPIRRRATSSSRWRTRPRSISAGCGTPTGKGSPRLAGSSAVSTSRARYSAVRGRAAAHAAIRIIKIARVSLGVSSRSSRSPRYSLAGGRYATLPLRFRSRAGDRPVHGGLRTDGSDQSGATSATSRGPRCRASRSLRRRQPSRRQSTPFRTERAFTGC